MSGYTWKIKRFSHMIDDLVKSDCFDVLGVKWVLLCMYCNGGRKIRPGPYSEFYIKVHEPGSLPDDWRVYAKFKIRIKSQRGISDKQIEADHWFSSDSGLSPSCSILMSEIYDSEKGFLLHDVLTVQVEFSVVGVLKYLD